MNDHSSILTSPKASAATRLAYVTMLREHEVSVADVLGPFLASRDPKALGDWAAALPETYLKALLATGPAGPIANPVRTGPVIPAPAPAPAPKTPKPTAKTKKAKATPKKKTGAAKANGATAPRAAAPVHAERLQADSDLVLRALIAKPEPQKMAELADVTKLKVPRLGTVMTHLRETNRVLMTGERGGTRYQIAAH